VPSIINLQECQSISSPCQPSSIVPVMFLRRIELGVVIPVEVERPRAVAHVVADEIEIPRVNEGGDTSVQQVGNIGRKVLHPIHVEAHVNQHVARLPGRVVLTHMQGRLGGVSVHKSLNVGEIIAKRIEATVFRDVIGVLPTNAVGRRECRVAVQEGCLASK